MLAVVTLEATDPTAYEAPTSTSVNWGYVTIRRDQAESTPLYVNYEVTGTATHNTDYSSLGANYSHVDNTTGLAVYRGTVTIPANQATATLTVKPANDALREDDETVIFKLLSSGSSSCGCGCGSGSGSSYTLGSGITASVTIEDNDDWTVNVEAIDATAKETGPGETSDPAKFRFTRSGETDLSKALTVYYSYSGTATFSSDFTVSGGSYYSYGNYGSISIPANQSYVDMTLNIVNDAFLSRRKR